MAIQTSYESIAGIEEKYASCINTFRTVYVLQQNFTIFPNLNLSTQVKKLYRDCDILKHVIKWKLMIQKHHSYLTYLICEVVINMRQSHMYFDKSKPWQPGRTTHVDIFYTNFFCKIGLRRIYNIFSFLHLLDCAQSKYPEVLSSDTLFQTNIINVSII